MVYAEHLLSFWESGIWVRARQRQLIWPAPQEKLWVLSLWWASWVGNISHVLSQHFAGRIKCILCDPSGRGPWQACTWFPQDFLSHAFSLADCALRRFAAVNSNWVQWYAESLSPPQESSNLGVALGTPDTLAETSDLKPLRDLPACGGGVPFLMKGCGGPCL